MASITIDKVLAPAPTATRAQLTQLSVDPKGQQIAYPSGKSIFLRSIDDPSLCKQYTSHTEQTTVARFSPSGFYIASGDVSGKVKVWDAIEAVNTKGEFDIIAGRINDIAWDGESKRLIAVGDGRQLYGRCIMADSGNSVGEISGHSRAINAVAMRQQRPLRAATVADDGQMCFLHGAPFKFNSKADRIHKGFVYGTAFSPDGSFLVTVGADCRIQLYDGKTGEPTSSIGDGDEAHKGSIFAVSWASDSKRIVTASADQTVRAWDSESGRCLQTWRFGGGTVATVSAQQVGVVWTHGRGDDLIISLSANGDLNYLMLGKPEPVRVVYGHNKSITALGGPSDTEAKELWTGSFDGRVCHWDLSTGTALVVEGSGHTNQVTGFAASSRLGHIYSVSWDDTLRTIDSGARTFTGNTGISLSTQPKGVASTTDGYIYVALSSSKVAVYLQDNLVAELPIDTDEPSTIVAFNSLIAIGSSRGNDVLVYKVADDHKSWKLSETLPGLNSSVSALAFSKDGSYLAIGTSSGRIGAYDTSTWKVATDRWSAHSGKVTSIAWNDAGTHAVSGALDTHIYLWSLAHPGNRVNALNAHKDGVSGVAWVEGGSKLASVGSDTTLKIWNIAGLD